MSINRQLFYEKLRNSKVLISLNKLSQSEVNGIEQILNTWDTSGYTDIRWLAYMLATSYHETAATMQPIEEYGKGKNRVYGKKIKMSRAPYTIPNKIYYGRGFVQLTWYENYELMGRLLKIPLLENPELALDLKIASQIMFEGMTKRQSSFGDFTGKCLEMYFTASKENPIGARAIINGSDKAQLIAKYYYDFKRCLS